MSGKDYVDHKDRRVSAYFFHKVNVNSFSGIFVIEIFTLKPLSSIHIKMIVMSIPIGQYSTHIQK